jgi:kynurenine formamidase
MAKGGVLTQKITCTMHTGTHCDAPRHVMEIEFDGKRARYTHEMPVDAYTGDAVCLPIEIERWGLSARSILRLPAKKSGSNRTSWRA